MLEIIRVVLLGADETGKTALCRRLKGYEHNQSYTPTVGVDFVAFQLK